MKVVCEHCGLPFSVMRATPGRAVYCCSGCALAARVPVDANGQFPVNSALIAALSTGFVFFNQILFWLLAVLLARREDAAALSNSGRFVFASLTVGIAVWATLAVFQIKSGARRVLDWIVLALALGGVVLALARANPAIAAIANGLLAAWSLRGLARKKVPRKN